MFEKIGIFPHFFATAAQNTSLDFGPYLSIPFVFLCGALSQRARRRALLQKGPLQIAMQGLICTGAAWTIIFSPLLEQSWSFPLIWVIAIQIIGEVTSSVRFTTVRRMDGARKRTHEYSLYRAVCRNGFFAGVWRAGIHRLGMHAEGGADWRELGAQGHHVQILSSYMLSYRAMSWRKEMTEQLSESCRVLYPGAWMMRPVGSSLNWLRADHIVHKVVSDFKPDAVIAYNTYVFESICTNILRKKIGNLPIVLEIEDMPLARKRGWLNVKPRLDRRCWNSMVRTASAFTAVNQSIFDELPRNKERELLPGVIDPMILRGAAERCKAFSRPGTRTVGISAA